MEAFTSFPRSRLGKGMATRVRMGWGMKGYKRTERPRMRSPVRTLVRLFLILFPEFLPVLPFSLKSPENPYPKICSVGKPGRSSLCSFQQGDKEIILSLVTTYCVPGTLCASTCLIFTKIL